VPAVADPDVEPSHYECRACGRGLTAARFTIDNFQILHCASCGSLTTRGSMNPDAATKFYSADYYHGGDYADYCSAESFSKANFARFADRLRRLKGGTRLLEVGCAYGFFLDVASSYWQVEGIDISEDAIRAASNSGHVVRQGDLQSVDLPSESYDWVVAWDTIEHLDQPRAYVGRMHQLLVPGGRIAMTTGDISSVAARISGSRWRLLTPPSHLTFFSRTGMRTMLTDAGFHNVTIGTAGYWRSMEFVAHRVLGPRPLAWIDRRLPSLRRRLAAIGFYINLFDVMFVTAQKPDR
jgi:SAM-dependent methyltransferase